MGRTVGTHQLGECENRDCIKVLPSLLLQVLLDYFCSTIVMLRLQRPLSPSLEWISDHLSSRSRQELLHSDDDLIFSQDLGANYRDMGTPSC